MLCYICWPMVNDFVSLLYTHIPCTDSVYELVRSHIAIIPQLTPLKRHTGGLFTLCTHTHRVVEALNPIILCNYCYYHFKFNELFTIDGGMR